MERFGPLLEQFKRACAEDPHYLVAIAERGAQIVRLRQLRQERSLADVRSGRGVADTGGSGSQ